MSDYMRGYNSRNRRRRASKRRRRSATKYYDMTSSYSPGRKYRTRRRGNTFVLSFARIAAVVLLVLAVLTVGGYFGLRAWNSFRENRDAIKKNPITDESSTVTVITGDAVQVASESAAAVTPDAVSPAATAIPGGVSEAVAAVGSISNDSITAPTPAPRSKAVALTFDDGPSTVNTPKVLTVLEKYKVHATFFIVGERVEAGADLLRKEVELGCELANHSWNHANLSKLSIKQVNKQFNKTSKAIKKVTGVDVELLRPPYGAISDAMRKKFKHPMLIWSVDTLDWKYHNGKKEFKVVKKEVSDGDIILMHDIHAESSDGAEKIIKWLLENDYDVLTVSELMERKGIKMKNGTVYASGK